MKNSKTIKLIKILVLSLLSLFSVDSAKAQVTSDDSLSTTISTSDNINFVINKGDRIGDNLLHSFQEFSIPINGSAIFQNDLNIKNIFSRVTGGSLSNIDGLIKTQGNANLFLINPSGIIFGQNSRLEINGSFFATTADSVIFNNGFEFSATNIQTPSLLTVDIPIGLRFRDNSKSITNQSIGLNQDGSLGLRVPSGNTLALIGGDVNLDTGGLLAQGGRVELGGLATAGTVRINNDGSLSFAANITKSNVSLTNSSVIAVAAGGGGHVGINARNLEISGGSVIVGGIFPGQGMMGAQAGDIIINVTDKFTITDSSLINNFVGSSSIGNAGDIVINTGVLEGIGSFRIGSGTLGRGDAGKVSITAKESFSLQGLQGLGSGITSAVAPSAVGNADEIIISTRDFSLSNGAQLATSTLGQGSAGNIKVNASNSISINSGSILQAATGGLGNAGKIIIDAQEANVSFDGLGTALITAVSGQDNIEGTEILGTGLGGDISINARKLDITNGARILSSTFGEAGVNGFANAGNIKVNVSDSVNLTNGSQFLSTTFGEGNAGKIEVIAGTLSLLDGSQIISSTYNRKNAGNVSINVRGNVTFDGTNINFVNEIPGSGVFSNIEYGATGNGGNINIKAGNLFITRGAQVQTLVRQAQDNLSAGQGNSGKVDITVDGVIKLDGVSEVLNINGANTSYSSLIATELGFEAIGKAGDIDIKAGELFITNGARLVTSTSGQGDAGNVKIDILGNIIFDGTNVILSNGLTAPISSGILSNIETGGNGNGGNIDIKAANLTLTSGAQVQTIARQGQNNLPAGQGNAGKVNIIVDDTLKLDGISQVVKFNGLDNNYPSLISTSLDLGATGSAGEINVKAKEFFITNGAQVSTSTFGRGNAGNLNINVKGNAHFDGFNTIFFNGIPFLANSGIQSNVEFNGIGNGGNIGIKASNLSLTNGAQVQTVVRRGFRELLPGNGNSGKVSITVDDTLKLDGVSEMLNLNGFDNKYPTVISTSLEFGTIGKAGAIEINAKEVFLTNGALLATVTSGQGDAGDVKIDVRENAVFDGFNITYNNGLPFFSNSGVLSNVLLGATGNGGNIKISGRNLILKNGAQINTSTAGNGDAGKIDINVREAINFYDFKTTNINGVNFGVFNLINSGVSGIQQKNGGDINIKAGSILMNDYGNVSTATSGRGNAGKISMQVDGAMKLNNLSTVGSTVNSGGEGISGDIDIKAQSLTLANGGQISSSVLRELKFAVNGQEIVTFGGKGHAGNITINVKDFIDIFGISSIQFPAFDIFLNQIPTVAFSSGVFTSAERGSTPITPQAAGNVNISTNSFRLADGALINALTSNSGNAGNIIINAKTFTATGGGQVITTTRNSGRAGNINLNISDSINISGSDSNFNQRLEQAQKFGEPEDIVNNQGAISGIFANTSPGSQGDGGSIFIDPQSMVITDAAGVGVNSQGSGKGGSIEIQAGALTLDNKAFISAETISNTGGDIVLKVNDILQLRRNSNISTTAGTSKGQGNGGNINIDTGFLVAVPRENSDITADSSGGRGGAINITAQGIFGFNVSNKFTPFSDIRAISQLSPSFNGQITLNLPEVDPSQGLVELPQTVVDPDALVAQNPCDRRIGSNFIVTGKGGIPQNPSQTLSNESVEVSLVEPATSSNQQTRKNQTSKNHVSSSEIVPAQGWIIDKDGKAILTPYSAQGTENHRIKQSVESCPM